MKIRFLGQSGFIITMPDGIVLMIDPWLSPSLLKSYVTPVKPGEINRCDIMLVSHSHIDHIDSTSLRAAKKLNSTFVGSRQAVRSARKAGIRLPIEMKPGDSIQISGLKIHAIPASHPFAPDAVGFIIEADKTVYFSGDTRYFPELVQELKRFRIDIALLQIACSVYFFKKDGMDMGDASRLAREISPRVAVPMHYHDISRRLDPEKFRAELADTGIRVVLMRPGEQKEY